MRLSRFRWNSGSEEWTPSIPVRPWTPSVGGAGGSRVTAGGDVVGYVVREDSLLTVDIRFEELEWGTARELIRWGKKGGLIEFIPDVANIGDILEVYLDAPRAGDTWRPERDSEYPSAFQGTIVLRSRVPGALLWRPYF